MFFSKKENLDKYEAQLADALRGIIGHCRDCCKNIVSREGFELIDIWEKKMGFVREDVRKTMILALSFQKGRCHNYQLVVRQTEQPWKKAHLIAFKYTPDPGFF